MPIIYNGATLTDIKFNGVSLDKVIYNGVTVFEKVSVIREPVNGEYYDDINEPTLYYWQYLKVGGTSIYTNILLWNGETITTAGNNIGYMNSYNSNGFTYYKGTAKIIGSNGYGYYSIYRIKN